MSPRNGRPPSENPKSHRESFRLSDDDMMKLNYCMEKTGMKKTDGEYVEIADRKEAIRYAILHAKEGDVIVLAGKGHEDYQEIHGVKHHMDERDLIREILEEEDVTNICGYNNRYFA